MNDTTQRYNGIAIGFHWLIAFLIISMLATGNFMVSLEESDPMRFWLTQLHKSFGIVAMILIVCRYLWRLTHRPPGLPDHMKTWEVRAAGVSHALLYLLIILIPVSGWIMVSASPLDLPTVVFNAIQWPHFPPFDSMPNKADISSLFADIHKLAGWALIGLLFAHIGATLRHQFILRDDVAKRMSPRLPGGGWAAGVVPLTGVVVIVVAALIAFGYSGSGSAPLGAGESRVDFTFTLQNEETQGSFSESSVELLLDTNNPAGSSLNATVNTATVTTGTGQIDSTLLREDWFDVEAHPQASFTSREMTAAGENIYSVYGTLRIKGIAKDIEFPMELVSVENKRIATGSFAIDRLDFELGRDSQPEEDSLGYQVVVSFEFEVQSQLRDQ